MTDRTDATAPPRRWLGVLLVASLALNLFFAGLLLGGPVLRGGPMPADRPGAGLLMPMPRLFVEALGPQRGRQVLRDIRREVPDLRTRFEAMRNTRLDLAAAVRTEPYDEAAVLAALERLRQTHFELTLKLDRPIADALGRMSPDERGRFAEVFAGESPRQSSRGGLPAQPDVPR